MDMKDVISDVIDDYLWDSSGHPREITGGEGEDLSFAICKALGICEKCGNKIIRR